MASTRVSSPPASTAIATRLLNGSSQNYGSHAETAREEKRTPAQAPRYLIVQELLNFLCNRFQMPEPRLVAKKDAIVVFLKTLPSNENTPFTINELPQNASKETIEQWLDDILVKSKLYISDSLQQLQKIEDEFFQHTEQISVATLLARLQKLYMQLLEHARFIEIQSKNDDYSRDAHLTLEIVCKNKDIEPTATKLNKLIDILSSTPPEQKIDVPVISNVETIDTENKPLIIAWINRLAKNNQIQSLSLPRQEFKKSEASSSPQKPDAINRAFEIMQEKLISEEALKSWSSQTCCLVGGVSKAVTLTTSSGEQKTINITVPTSISAMMDKIWSYRDGKDKIPLLQALQGMADAAHKRKKKVWNRSKVTGDFYEDISKLDVNNIGLFIQAHEAKNPQEQEHAPPTVGLGRGVQ